MKHTRPIVVIVAALLIAGIAWIIFKPGEKPKGTEFRVGIGTFSEAIDYAPFYVARHFHWFEEELKAVGVTTEPDYKQFNNFDEIQSGFAQKKLHAFFSAEAPATKLHSEKQDIRIVEVGCTLQQEIVVRAALNITSVSQLKGKNVAVAEGTSSHYGLLRILATAGLSGNDISLKPGFPGDSKPKFENGDVDAWAVWPPFVEEQVVAKRGTTLPGGDAKIQSVLSLHSSVMGQEPAVGKAIVRAIQKAKKWLAANPDEAQSIIAKQLKLDTEVVKLAWPKHNWGATLTDDVLADIQQKSEFLTERGVVQNGVVVKLDEVVDKRYLQQ
jgi:sulfonate transport system substrate-binding protein